MSEAGVGKLIGFIDLLGTKDSAKVSKEKFYNYIEDFLAIVALNLGNLKNSPRIQYLSDSAFFEISIDRDSFECLRRVRKSLFEKRIYFKCALVEGEMQPQEVDRAFLKNLLQKKQNMKLADEDATLHRISKNITGFFFSPKAIPAYLMHESFKGIGFVVDQKLAEKIENEFVRSVYFGSDFKAQHRYFDLRFQPDFEIGSREDNSGELKEGQDFPILGDIVAGDDIGAKDVGESYVREFVNSLTRASAKKRNFSKYYIPTIISMINSCDYSELLVDDDGNLVGNPVVYSIFVTQNVLNRVKPKIIGAETIHWALLDCCLKSLLKRRDIAELNAKQDSLDEEELTQQKSTSIDGRRHFKELENIEKAIDLVCSDFRSLPGFLNSLQLASENLLSSSSREEFLERMVS